MKIKVFFAAALLLIRLLNGPAVLPAQEAVSRDTAAVEGNTPALSLEQASVLEAQLAADALRETVAYFRDLGFSLPAEASVKVLFQDPIIIKGRVWDCAHGVFDPETATIWMIRYDSEQFQSCRLFGLEPRPELYRAILVHEFTHYINSLVSPGLIPTVDEAIAGTVQFMLLEPSLREKILASYEIKNFGNFRDLCMSAYMNEPDDFLLASYSYNSSHPVVFRRLLEQRGPVLKDPFFID
jgi:hypothetical protein